jgi:hypothetical protein
MKFSISRVQDDNLIVKQYNKLQTSTQHERRN